MYLSLCLVECVTVAVGNYRQILEQETTGFLKLC